MQPVRAIRINESSSAYQGGGQNLPPWPQEPSRVDRPEVPFIPNDPTIFQNSFEIISESL